MPIIFFPISALINFLTSTILGILIFSKSFKNPLNQSFIFFAASVAFWSLFYFLWQISLTPTTALLNCKLLMVGAAFIPATFFHFTVNLMEIYKRYKKYVLAFYVLSLMFILTDFSSLMVCGVTQRMIFKYWPTPGSLYLPYLCFFLGVVVFAHILIFRRLDKVTEIKRNQIKYVALGTAIGFLGGATNYPLWFNIPILPLGNVLVSVYVLLVAFSIIKYHLMDIRLVISNTTIFIVVYALVLGLPFLLGYKYNLWQLSTWAMLPLASIGPFISQYLQRKAGDKILQEEKRILDVLKKLSLGLIIIRDLRKLFNLVSHVLITNFSAKIFEIYILNHETNLYILKHCVPERPIQSILSNDPLIDCLSEKKYSVVSEEVRFMSFGEKKENIIAKEIVASLDRLSAEVAIPLMGEKRLLGFIIMGGRPRGFSYSPEMINGLSVVGNQMALSLEIIMSFAERDKLLNENFQKSRFESLALLCTSISHQMNNRFASIINVIFEGWETYKEGNYKSLSKEEMISLYEGMGENAGKAIETAQGGAEITRAVLDYSKSKVEFGIVNFNEAVDKSIEFIQLKRSNCKLNVVKDYPDNVLLWAAQAPVHDIISNALDNSWFALNQKIEELNPPAYIPQIQIRGRLNGTMFHFEIEDNGLGIKKENINRVLDPMFTTKSNQDGTGLGTTVMLQFIQKLGGTISYESEYKQWTRVKISLPLAIDDNKNGG